MNVLYVQPGPGIGGSKVSLYHMLKCAPPSQKSYLALSAPAQEEFETMVKDYVEEFFYLELPTWQKYHRETLFEKLRAPFGDSVRIIKLIPSTKHLIKIIQNNSIDLVHTNNSILAPGAIAAWLTKKPHVWHIREPFGSILQYHPILGDKISYLLIKNMSGAIICNSKYTAEPFFVNKINHSIIYNGVDIDQFTKLDQSNKQLLEIMTLSENDVVLGMVGNLTTEWKRHDLFIKMAAILTKNHQNLKFITFGSSRNLNQTAYTKKLAKLIRDLKITNQIVFIDFISEPVKIMNSLNIMVHPAITEGSGRIIMEAMAAGKPVVAMKSCGVQELIQDGLTGFLVEPGNVQAMAERVDQLVSNPALRERIGINARKYAQEHFSDQESMNAIVRIYQKLVAEQGR